MGESSTSVNLAALLTQSLLAQGRHEEAVAVSDVTPADDDVSAHVHLSSARALALASVGRLDEAEQLAVEAVERAWETDFLVMWGDSLCDLAEIRRLANGATAATPLLTQALDLYVRKQHFVAIQRTKDLLAALVDVT
jgi:hypothetical protein